MRTVILGKESPLTVSAVGLGCMGMVSAYPPIPEKKIWSGLPEKHLKREKPFLILLKSTAPI